MEYSVLGRQKLLRKFDRYWWRKIDNENMSLNYNYGQAIKAALNKADELRIIYYLVKWMLDWEEIDNPYYEFHFAMRNYLI